MTELARIARALDEATLAAERDGVRGWVVGELRRLYELAAGMTGLPDEDPDVRWAELSVRVLDRVVKLYRLDQQVVAEPVEVNPEAVGDALRTRVLAQFESMNTRPSSPDA